MKQRNILRALSVLSLVLVYMCIGQGWVSAAERLYAEPINIEPGETRTLVFNLENENPYYGFQADILLPKGLAAVLKDGKPDVTLSSRADDSYTVVSNILADNTIRVGTFSTAHNPFTGKDGALMYLPVKASADFSGGEIEIRNALLVNAEDKDVPVADTSAIVGDKYNNRFYIPDFTIAIGETKKIGIKLDNEIDFTAFQTDLYLPKGLAVAEDSFRLSSRAADGHTVSVKKSGEGRIRIACMSNSGSLFSGHTGTLLEFDVTTYDGVAESCIIELKNQIFSSAKAKEYFLPDSKTEVTTEKAKVTEIELTTTTVSMFVGESIALKATVTPDYAYQKTLEWVSSNPEIASVSPEGVITAKGVGSAIISVKATDGSEVSASCAVTVSPVLASSVTLNAEDLTLLVGQSDKLTAKVLPENTTNPDVTWTSSDESIVKVSADGTVTAVSVGVATITATCGSVSATCKVTVNPVLASSVILNTEDLTLLVGQSDKLTAKVLPDNTTNPDIVWTSDNEAVAKVDSDGMVTAVSVGVATITATCGNVSATCKVTVNPVLASSVTLSVEDLTLLVGQSDQLTAKVLPENTTNPDIIWTSDNEAVAKVSADGTVTAVSVGVANITATCGTVSATCKVTVLPIWVESIVLTPEVWSGVAGDCIQLTATVLPEDATDKSLSWSSSDDTIATVDNTGFVSIQKSGTCIITAIANDGSGVKAECVVTGLSGIDESLADNDAKVDVYTLNGMLLRKGCDKAELQHLVPGTYIVQHGNRAYKLQVTLTRSNK